MVTLHLKKELQNKLIFLIIFNYKLKFKKQINKYYYGKHELLQKRKHLLRFSRLY